MGIIRNVHMDDISINTIAIAAIDIFDVLNDC